MIKNTQTLLKQATNQLLFAKPSLRAFSGGLNQFYIPNQQEPVKFTPKSNKPKGISRKYSSDDWNLEEVTKATEEHVVYTWGATDPSRKAAMAIKRGEGIYLYDYSGNKYVDMTS